MEKELIEKITINGSDSVNYYIHGQDLNLKFSFPNALFVSIYYNEIPVSYKFKTRPFWFWQRIRFFKNTGEYNVHFNVHHPYIRITKWFLWSLPERINIPIKVNQVKVKCSPPSWKLRQIDGIKNHTLVLPTKLTMVSKPKFKKLKCKFIDEKTLKYKSDTLAVNYSDNFKINHPLYIKNKKLWNNQPI